MASLERRPRVLHIATSHNDGGIERYSVRLAAGLAEHGGFQGFACLPGAIVERLCHASALPTFPLTVRNSGDWRAAAQIAAYLKDQSIDIVHVHSRRDYLPALFGVALARMSARKGRPVPRLVLHAHLIRPLGMPPALSGWFFARHADRVLAVSHAVQDALMAWHRFTPGFVRLLHNGVDMDRFCVPSSPSARAWRTAVRDEWGLDDNALVVTMIGRLDAKGQKQMLAALPSLLLRAPNLHVVLVGSEDKSGSRAALQALARAGGVSERVKFTGTRENIPQILAASDILAHLPADESFGLALAEAMAAGLPTISSNIGGCREVVQHGETGILVPVGDASALVEALQSLLAGDDAAERRLRMGMAGRAWAKQEYSLAHQIRRLEEIYQELCPNLGSSAAPLSMHRSPS